MRRTSLLATLFAFALTLAGCSRYEPLSLHGAGSMRVEVEVYKGPLTQPLEGQVGQLVAVLSQSIYALDGWESQARVMLGSMGCPPGANENRVVGQGRDCVALTSAYNSAGDALDFGCYIVRTPTLNKTIGHAVWVPMGTCSRRPASRHLESAHSDELEKEFKKCELTNSTQKGLLRCQGPTIVLAVDNLATLMRTAAFRAADGNVRFVPRRREVRGLVTSFGFIASEFGNQLQARIIVLQKQFAQNSAGQPGDPRMLPMTDYLRDAGNTDFIQLFDWLNATADGGFGGFPRGKLDPQERIRMAQRLTSDYYWQKINEVYTSGQGDVSMAFIKDDLGNWDLKSFSNDPTELLRSYRRVTDAALKSASRLARTATTGGQLGLAERAAGFANQVATGEVSTPAPAGELGLPALRDRISARLAAERARFSTHATTLTNEIAVQDGKIEAATERKNALAAQVSAGDAVAIAQSKTEDDAIQAARLEKLVLERRKAELPRDAMAAVNQILDDHLATVAAMQQSVTGTQTTPPSP
jgi:hypothetical protein